MNKELKWYAVGTRPRWEKKVAGELDRKGIEHYCPLNKVLRQWSDRKKLVLEPLFTGYVFIRGTETEHLKVKQTDGVINMLYWLGKPAIVKDDEITAIRQFLVKHETVQVEKAKLNIDDKVRIVRGPLLSMEGNIIQVMNKSVKLFLPSLGFNIIAHVQCAQIQKVLTSE